MNRINSLKKRYVINQVKNIKMPEFKETLILRKNIIFSGKVQRVGFRLEVFELAKRLKLIGWVKNREDESVEAEIQGENDKIIFLVEFMKSLKRATVNNLEIKEIDIDKNEIEFVLIEGEE
ncbi:MAG: acylphosphatase [Gudongella sp.]|nr:acylphosphatase [Gudongella sp.]